MPLKSMKLKNRKIVRLIFKKLQAGQRKGKKTIEKFKFQEGIEFPIDKSSSYSLISFETSNVLSCPPTTFIYYQLITLVSLQKFRQAPMTVQRQKEVYQVKLLKKRLRFSTKVPSTFSQQSVHNHCEETLKPSANFFLPVSLSHMYISSVTKQHLLIYEEEGVF